LLKNPLELNPPGQAYSTREAGSCGFACIQNIMESGVHGLSHGGH
jgi:hypothetical protein